jgi:hypothetical protein
MRGGFDDGRQTRFAVRAFDGAVLRLDLRDGARDEEGAALDGEPGPSILLENDEPLGAVVRLDNGRVMRALFHSLVSSPSLKEVRIVVVIVMT